MPLFLKEFKVIDCNFPVIQYLPSEPPVKRGLKHGESFRQAIKELVGIRTDLMREKNRSLNDDVIERLAQEQWQATARFDTRLIEELQGIADGAAVSIAELVILNNYTDFRDIQVADQGCSLAYVNEQHGPIVGQTWDMHGSAKNYVCCIQIDDGKSNTVLFSVVGCVGMMGFNNTGGMLGVNNINTDGAKAGVMWPVIVRKVLEQQSLSAMEKCLTGSPKTSGHNYLIAVVDHAQMWEVAPGCNDLVEQKKQGEKGFMFHTNHCLGEQMKLRETTISQNSTTHIRFDLLEKKIGEVCSLEQMYQLMHDHENYPKSICSNFQTDAQDPSITCGGAVGHLESGKVLMWRGDKLYDDNFVEREFDLSKS